MNLFVAEEALNLADFILILSALIHSSFVLYVIYSGLNRRNFNFVLLLISLSLYSATFFTHYHINDPGLVQNTSGLAAVAVAVNAVYFLYHFPVKRRPGPWIKYYTACGLALATLAIYPGLYPNFQLGANQTMTTDVTFAAYLMAPFSFWTVGIIIRDIFTYGKRRYFRLRRYVLLHFLAFAFIAIIVDIIVPFFTLSNSILFSALAPGSSVIFGIGLYAAMKKSNLAFTIQSSTSRLITIFLSLLVVFAFGISAQTNPLIRFGVMALAFKVALDTLKSLRSEERAHDELRRTHLAVSEYVADLAHRLKTPLAIIQGRAELGLVDKPERVERPEEALRDISRVATTTATTLRNLVQASKIDAATLLIRPARADLARLLMSWRADLAALAPNHQLAVNVSRPCPAFVDVALLRESLFNLVDNAQKYSPAGTTITVSARALARQTALKVRDTGVGISRRDLARIFIRHFQVRATRQPGSAGLGLSLVHYIVLQHGGQIDVASRLGHGTTFIIKLPRPRRWPVAGMESRSEPVSAGAAGGTAAKDETVRRRTRVRKNVEWI